MLWASDSASKPLFLILSWILFFINILLKYNLLISGKAYIALKVKLETTYLIFYLPIFFFCASAAGSRCLTLSNCQARWSLHSWRAALMSDNVISCSWRSSSSSSSSRSNYSYGRYREAKAATVEESAAAASRVAAKLHTHRSPFFRGSSLKSRWCEL